MSELIADVRAWLESQGDILEYEVRHSELLCKYSRFQMLEAISQLLDEKLERESHMTAPQDQRSSMSET